MAGMTLTDLSLSVGLNRNACSLALSVPWPKAEAAIAKLLGFEPWEIWPDRYDAERRPTRGRPARAAS